MKILFFIFFIINIFATTGYAQYPEKPINIYVPFAAGGAADNLMREVAGRMSIILKQKINIYANNTKLSPVAAVRNSVALPADGYNFIVGNLGTHGSAPALDKMNLRYNPEIDFEPVGMLGETPLYLVIRQDLPVDNFQDLVSYLRKYKTGVTMASAGNGSTAYLAGLYFNSILKITPTIIPYTGSDPALKDISYGYVDMMIDQSTSALPFIQSKLVKGIAYTSRIGRSKNDIALQYRLPSFSQVGLPEFNITGWNILFAPRGTNRQQIAVINKALRQALTDKIIQGNLRLKDTIIYPDSENSPEALKQFIHQEISRWAEIINIAKQF